MHPVGFFYGLCLFGISDSLEAAKAANHPEENLGPDGLLLLEISEMLMQPRFLYLKHMRRSANEVAHHLARFVLSCSSDIEWLGGHLPLWFSDIVSRDF